MVAMADLQRKTWTSRLARLRVWVQGAFVVVWLGPLVGRFHGFCSPVYHCHACPLALFACPIGVIANFSAIHVFPFIAVGTLVLVGGLVGTFVCGWACPFGLLQDLAAKIAKPRIRLPRWAGVFRYVVLIALVVVVPYIGGKDHPLFICRVCPAGAVEAAVPYVVSQAMEGPVSADIAGEPDASSEAQSATSGADEGIHWPSALKIAILVLFLIAIFVRFRPWCTLFCPLGAVLSLFNRVSVFFLKFHPDRCTHCGACAKTCKCSVDPERQPNDSRCIRCLECTKCGALTVSSVFSRSRTGASSASVSPASQPHTSSQPDSSLRSE